MKKQSDSRRNFIKKGAALTAFAAAGGLINAAPFGLTDRLAKSPFAKSRLAGKKNFLNGIQVSPVSFLDEGVEKVLDIFKERGINTIFVSMFSYDRGISGRQMPGHPLPDHGAQEYDTGTYHGGFYGIPHAEFYTQTSLKGDKMRAPDFGDLDILAQVLPAAKKRGIRVFASVLDSFDYPEDVPGISDLTETTLYGKKASAMCFYKPDVRNFWLAVVTDLASSYDVDGIMFYNERNGPLINAVGATHADSFSSTTVTCFCKDHQRQAEAQGMDFQRVKEGYMKLDEFVQRSLKDIRPSDGYYVEFQRLLLSYPEIMAYHLLFDKGKHAILSDIRDAVKKVNNKLQVGFHIEHVNSFNPFYRATRDYEDLASKADILKVVAYNNCGGERYVKFINNIHSSLFRDVPPEELMRFNNHLLNYGAEPSLADLPAAGFTADYVYRETQRAVTGAKGKCKILTGIDIGIPTDPKSRKASADDTYAATMAAFRGGADGVILSRKYSEMMMANLDAAGRAIKTSTKIL
jgi:hypothetical protein